MSATKVQANWAAVAHASTTITRVNSVNVAQGGQVTKYAGDIDKYNTVAVVLMSEPTVSVQTADIGTAQGIAVGTTGVFTATHNDIKLATGGAVVYTVTSAVLEDVQASGDHAAVGTATMTFQTVSADGATNPVAITRT